MAFRDALLYVIPLKTFTAERMITGEVPFWNPFNGFGEPWFANPQTGILYPPTYLFLLPAPVAFSLYTLLHLIILAWGCHALFRNEGYSRVASAGGTVVGTLSGPILSAIDISFALSSLSFLPWVILFARQGRHRLFALTLALSFLAGEPMVSLVLCMAGGGIWLFSRQKVKHLMMSVVLFLGIIAPQLYLTTDFFLHSDRFSGIDEAVSMNHRVHPKELGEMVLGQGWGVPAREPIPFRQQIFLLSTYLGTFPVILLLLYGRSPENLALLTILTALLLISMGANTFLAPLLQPIFHFFRYPAKFLLFIPILVAWGVAHNFDRLNSRAIPWLFMLLGLTVPLIFISTYPERVIVHITICILTGAVLVGFKKRVSLIPWLMIGDYLYAFYFMLTLMPAWVTPEQSARWTSGQTDRHASLINPPDLQKDDYYSPASDLKLLQAVSGYSNLYYDMAMADTSAPMVLKTYREPKGRLPGVKYVIKYDSVSRGPVTRIVEVPAPLVWSRVDTGAELIISGNELRLVRSETDERSYHLGVTFDRHWEVRGHSESVRVTRDDEGFVFLKCDPGTRQVVLTYRPDILWLMLLSIFILGFVLTGFRFHQRPEEF